MSFARRMGPLFVASFIGIGSGVYIWRPLLEEETRRRSEGAWPSSSAPAPATEPRISSTASSESKVTEKKIA